MSKPEIRSEYSAQRRSAPPNPAVSLAVSALEEHRGRPLRGLRVADQGCGQLRHYPLIAPLARELVLVDTESQLAKVHQDGERTFTVRGFADEETSRGRLAVRVISVREFEKARLRLDLIFCVAVCDVVPRKIRRRVIEAGARNLRNGGHYVLIVPRNDSSILARCASANRFDDGHVFSHKGVHTFYANLDSTHLLRRWSEGAGLQLTRDMSRYRQLCLVFEKTR